MEKSRASAIALPGQVDPVSRAKDRFVVTLQLKHEVPLAGSDIGLTDELARLSLDEIDSQVMAPVGRMLQARFGGYLAERKSSRVSARDDNASGLVLRLENGSDRPTACILCLGRSNVILEGQSRLIGTFRLDTPEARYGGADHNPVDDGDGAEEAKQAEENRASCHGATGAIGAGHDAVRLWSLEVGVGAGGDAAHQIGKDELQVRRRLQVFAARRDKKAGFEGLVRLDRKNGASLLVQRSAYDIQDNLGKAFDAQDVAALL